MKNQYKKVIIFLKNVLHYKMTPLVSLNISLDEIYISYLIFNI